MKVFAIAFALLQLGLQGVFAVSDGYAESASSHIAPVHAEAPGNTHHRLHGDDCVVCHVIAARSTVPPRQTHIWLIAGHLAVVPVAAVDAKPYAIVDGARLARAPPVSV